MRKSYLLLVLLMLVFCLPTMAEDVTPTLGDNSAYTLTEVTSPTGDNVITRYEKTTVTKYYDKQTGLEVAEGDRQEGVEYKEVQTVVSTPKYYRVALRKTEYGEGDNSQTVNVKVIDTEVPVTVKYNNSTTKTYDTEYKDNDIVVPTVVNPTGTWNTPTQIYGTSVYEVNTGESTSIDNAVFENNSIKAGASSTTTGNKYVDFSNGIIYNQGEITSITADFVSNSLEFTLERTDGYICGYLTGGGIISNKGTIGDINGNFVDNTVSLVGGTSTSTNLYGGGIVGNYAYGYNSSSTTTATIGNITGDFVNNTVTVNNYYLYGGGIVGIYAYANGTSTTTTATIGDITGDFLNNTVTVKSYLFGGGIVGNYAFADSSATATATIGNITGDFLNNTVTASGLYGGGIVGIYAPSSATTTTTIGDITGAFVNNTVSVSNYIYGGGIVGIRAYANNSSTTTITIGDITGDFLNNTVTVTSSYLLGGIVGNYASAFDSSTTTTTIGNITGDFVNNTVTASGLYGGGIVGIYALAGNYATATATIGDITGDFLNNTVTASYLYGGGIVGNYALAGTSATTTTTIGDITGDFLNNTVIASYLYGGGIVGNYAYAYNSSTTTTATIGDITGDFRDNTLSITNSPYYALVGNYCANEYSYANIGAINSNFYNNSITATAPNTTYHGGIIMNYGTNAYIESISGEFVNNGFSVDESVAMAKTYGGLIYNNGTINGITNSVFENNYIKIKAEAYGGVICNEGNITKVNGVFKGNYTYTYGPASTSAGGAIYNLATIGSISNSEFTGNYSRGGANVQGGALRNSGVITNGIKYTNFTGNYVYATNNDARGGAIYNLATIGSISNSEFTGNYSRGGANAQGGAIYNNNSSISKVKNTTFSNNSVTSTGVSQGGAVFNNNYGNIVVLSGNFTGNYAQGSTWVEGGAIWNSNMATISSIVGNFENNYVKGVDNAQGGAIYNNWYSTIDTITGNFTGNYAEGNTARGGAIFNNVANLNYIKNSVFKDNYTKSENGTSQGGAIWTNADITFQADNGLTAFSGNYSEVNGVKEDNAIYVDKNGATLTLKATNNGVIKLDDNINGADGYNVKLTGDSTSMINLNNDIKNANVSTEKVLISTANGTTHNYNFNSLTSNANTKYVIDIDTDNTSADTFTTANASSGTITVSGVNGIGNNFGTSQKYQILFTQDRNLQLDLSDEIKNNQSLSEYEIGRVETIDQVLIDTKWDDIYNRTTHSITYGTIALDTTSTTNDSLLINVTKIHNTIKKVSLGDTLKLVNQSTLGLRNFNFETSKDVYTVSDNIGTTGTGTLCINGVADKNSKSTIDFDGLKGFVLANNTAIVIKNAKIQNAKSDKGAAISSIGVDSNIYIYNSEFTNNTATLSGSAIANINSTSTVNIISSTFENNQSVGGYGGALTNRKSNIETIVNTNFLNNSATANNGIAQGGAILNNDNASIDTITGTFSGNYTQAGLYSEGGAIWNGSSSSINEISAVFTGNYSLATDNAQGGAIYNNNSTIGTLSGTFTGNYAEANIARGGALFLNNSKAIPNVKNAVFKNNYTKSENGTSKGGAIWTNTNLNVQADNGLTAFSGNYSEVNGVKESNAIYVANSGATLTLEAKNNGVIKLDDAVNGLNGYKVKVTGDESGTVVLNNELKNANVSLENTTLNVTNNNALASATQVNLNSGTLSLQNNKIGTVYTPVLNLNGNTNLALDVNLANKTIDKVVADTVNIADNAMLNVNSLNILKSTTAKEVSIQFADAQLANHVEYTGENSIVYSPIYKYKASYSVDETDGMGYFTFVRGSSGNSSSYNPSVLASPVSQQTGTYTTQLNTLNYAFQNADLYMNLPSAERLVYKNRNRYALSNAGVFSPLMTGFEDTGFWIKPYATFENIPLKHGPKVNSISYGTLVGYDALMVSLKHGWDRVFTYYLGYNGASQNYSGVDCYQNGGLLGATMTLYKGNFFTATTLSAGATVGEAHTMYGTEYSTTMFAGIGNKTGYNIEFNQGRFIIQPSMLLAYTFLNTFDYKNAAGVQINSDPTSMIQIAPTVRFVVNTKKGWQPYLAVGMVWNILAHSNIKANNEELPDMYTKPYVQYGLGVQRVVKDRFTAFGQAMIYNGGRNGVSLTAGVRYALGKDGHKHTSGTPKVVKKAQPKVVKELPKAVANSDTAQTTGDKKVASPKGVKKVKSDKNDKKITKQKLFDFKLQQPSISIVK